MSSDFLLVFKILLSVLQLSNICNALEYFIHCVRHVLDISVAVHSLLGYGTWDTFAVNMIILRFPS